MAATSSPFKGRGEMSLPMPPPLLHTRSGNELYDDTPKTPTSAGLASPYATPQGSPSKNKLPPGANELSGVFDTAMKLAASPTKARQQLAPHSPNKGGRQIIEEGYDENTYHAEYSVAPGSPLKKGGKENTPPGFRSPKPSTPNQAAISRQEAYQIRDLDESSRARYQPPRGLTPEELEKAQSTKVKRLANVTQLCKFLPCTIKPPKLRLSARLSRLLLRPAQLRFPSSESSDYVCTTISSPARNERRRV